jgi:hypothetical protein
MSNKSKRRFLKPPGKCIFCGRLAGSVDRATGQTVTLSKQHLWPKWMQKPFPKTNSNHAFVRVRLIPFPGRSIAIMPSLDARQGDVKSRRLRIVCEQHCNNGWISGIENATREFLVALIRGEAFTLLPDHQRTFATWLSIAMTMWEFTDPPTMAIPSEDRAYLCSHREPPPGWHMWIGQYQGIEWVDRYRHHGLCAFERIIRLPLNTSHEYTPNYQISSLQTGALFMHVSSSTVPGIILDESKLRLNGLHPLWPLSGSNICWPSNTILSDSAVNMIADRRVVTSIASLRALTS